MLSFILSPILPTTVSKGFTASATAIALLPIVVLAICPPKNVNPFNKLPPTVSIDLLKSLPDSVNVFIKPFISKPLNILVAVRDIATQVSGFSSFKAPLRNPPIPLLTLSTLALFLSLKPANQPPSSLSDSLALRFLFSSFTTFCFSLAAAISSLVFNLAASFASFSLRLVSFKASNSA